MVIKGDPESEKWDKEKYPGAVLLADHIQYWVDRKRLIVDDTFSPNQLKPAKYDVRLGNLYYKKGQYIALDENVLPLVIEPYELVFVQSYEIFKIPDNIVLVYDLRVNCCLGGLGLQTGLQLDPTYYGRIFCPLFNFSDKPVTLKYQDHIASAQFIYSTLYTLKVKEISKPIERQNLMSLKQALSGDPPQSGIGKLYSELNQLKTQITEKINDLEKEREKREEQRIQLETKIEGVISSNFSAMAFIIGALAVVVSAVTVAVTKGTTASSIAVAIGTGVVILVIGLFLLYQRKK